MTVAEFGVKNQSGCHACRGEQTEVLQAVVTYATLRQKTGPGLKQTPLVSHGSESLTDISTLL